MFGDVRNTQGEKLDYTVHQGPSQAVVVLGHGVTGNKDRPFVVALAEALAAAGMTTLRMSFSGNGDSEGRFQDSTISKEVADLGSLLDALGQRPVCYVGHSMGGAVGVLRAAQDDRVQWLVSLSGMVHTQAFAEREFADQTPDVGCMWEEESCPLSSTYINDMAAIHSVVDQGSQVRVPWLLVHGSEDDVVPLQDSRDIVARGALAHLQELAGADHVFSDAATAPMIDIVVPWVRQQLGT
jgi:uncharacterized protein